MNGVLTRLVGCLRTSDLITGISHLLALARLVGLVDMLPWPSDKDPALTILHVTSSDREPTPETLDSIRTSIGIDGGPFHIIGHWLTGVARGDLSRSWAFEAGTGPDAMDAFRASLSLMAAALDVGVIVATALVLPAPRGGPRARARPRGEATPVTLTSLPEYLLVPIPMLVLAVYLRILPPFKWGSPEKVIMPVLSLDLPTGDYLSGLVSDAVTATSPERWMVAWSTAGVHGWPLTGAVLRRVLASPTGQVALVVAILTGGAAAVEKIFAIPRLGRELLDATSTQGMLALQAQVLLLFALALAIGITAGAAWCLLMGWTVGAGGLTAPPPVKRPRRVARVVVVSDAVLLAFMVVARIRHNPYAVVAGKLAQPSAALPLSTDSLGRDVLARVAHGTVSTVNDAVIVTMVRFVIVMLVELVPRVTTGFIEVANVAPPILAGLIAADVSGPSAMDATITTVDVGRAPPVSHAVGPVARNRQCPDVLFAPVLGGGRIRITLTWILPVVIDPLACHAVLRLPGKALALAALGFLGLGAQSPAPEWGLVLSDVLLYIERAPQAAAAPVVALAILPITSVAASRSMRR